MLEGESSCTCFVVLQKNSQNSNLERNFDQKHGSNKEKEHSDAPGKIRQLPNTYIIQKQNYSPFWWVCFGCFWCFGCFGDTGRGDKG